AGDDAGLLFVQALRQLDALFSVEASRMQRAQRSRELAHLQKELRREDLHSGLRYLAVGDQMPQRMPAEGTAFFYLDENLAHECVTRCSHRQGTSSICNRLMRRYKNRDAM